LKDNNFKAILFDLDGTLLDSLDDLSECANSAIASKGFPIHTTADYKVFVGDGVQALIKRACPEGTDQHTLDECIALMKNFYSENWSKHSTLYPGIADLLTRCSELKISLNILSNKPDSFCKKIAEHYLADWKFDLIRGALDEFPLKPDPSSAINIIKKSNFSANEWIYLGDTDTDMQTASNANLKAVGVSWGFRSSEELLQNGANLVINSPLELLDLF